MNFSKDDAYRIFSNCTLAPRTARLADYWLSICDADSYPARAAIVPSQIKALLLDLIIFRVVPGRSVTVRMAGTRLYSLLQFELTGKDWLAVTPRKDRDERLSIFSDVAQGRIALGRWNFRQGHLREIRCEKLLLPLRAAPGDSDVPVLCFMDWTSSNAEAPEIDLKTIPLPERLGPPASKKQSNAPQGAERPSDFDVK